MCDNSFGFVLLLTFSTISETATASCFEKVVLKCTDSNPQATTERSCLIELFLKIKQTL